MNDEYSQFTAADHISQPKHETVGARTGEDASLVEDSPHLLVLLGSGGLPVARAGDERGVLRRGVGWITCVIELRSIVRHLEVNRGGTIWVEISGMSPGSHFMSEAIYVAAGEKIVACLKDPGIPLLFAQRGGLESLQ